MDNWLLIIGVPFIAAVIGYFVGSVKFFQEHKLRMYGKALPALLRYGFRPEEGESEDESNQALSKIWLYGSRDVCDKMELALSRLVKPSRGNFVDALKEVIVTMRKDVQPSWRLRKRSLEKGHPIHFHFRSGQ